MKYLRAFLIEYIFIFLTATLFFFGSLTKSFSEDNVFTINNVKIEGIVDLNFSREKYLNKAFMDSFEILMSKVLLTKDQSKVGNIKLKEIKSLINNFQILKESYSKNKYKLNLKIVYEDSKVKKFLSEKNISFSEPEPISVLLYPVLFFEDEIQNFNENYFYTEWLKVKIKNEIINFILPVEDLEDISKIVHMKNKIEELNESSFIEKYDVKNYVFLLMDYQDKKLNVYVKTNFENSKISKNFIYNLNKIENETELDFILKDLKLKITDIWKEQNLINLLMPLSINLKFEHKNLTNLNTLRKNFEKISIIDNYTLEEFDINDSFFKIYYYGSPKKFKSEMLKFGYGLKNNQGFWQIYLNE